MRRRTSCENSARNTCRADESAAAGPQHCATHRLSVSSNHRTDIAMSAAAASPPAARLSAAELESVFAVAKLTQYVDKFRQAGFIDGRDIVSHSTRPAIRAGPIVCRFAGPSSADAVHRRTPMMRTCWSSVCGVSSCGGCGAH